MPLASTVISVPRSELSGRAITVRKLLGPSVRHLVNGRDMQDVDLASDAVPSDARTAVVRIHKPRLDLLIPSILGPDN